MSYAKAGDLRRVEEGPAILSRFPIVRTDALLLSRNVDDGRDEHQRLCIHAAISVPGWGIVDVFSVHLSLLEQARNQSVLELWDLVSDPARAAGDTQILMGDMNAEPHEFAMRFLAGEVELEGRRTDFVDAWRALHPEPEPRSNDTDVQRDALTFPSDKPTKRIDFVLVRGRAAVAKAWLAGQDPLEGVGKEFGDDGSHLGMTHKDSKVWASDHRAVVVDLSHSIG